MAPRPRVHVRVLHRNTDDTLRVLNALGIQQGGWSLAVYVQAATVEKAVRGVLRVKGWHHDVVPSAPQRAALVIVLEDRHDLGPTFITDTWALTEGSTARFGLFNTRESFATRSIDSSEWANTPEPPPLPVEAPAPSTPTPAPPSEPRLAAFLVPTTFRPELLRVALLHLEKQTLPAGWTMEIVVAGESGDPGRTVAQQFPKARYVVVSGRQVTDKLNAALRTTAAELILAADDDDIQPMNRLVAAVRAHEAGFDFSGSGTLWFYDIRFDELTKWTGPPGNHLVGTSVSVRAELLRRVGGWPNRAKGKDLPLAQALLAAGARFCDLTTDLAPNLVALQHDKNLWNRPRVAEGQKGRRGSFEIDGFGPLGKNLTRFEPQVQASLKGFSQARIPDAPVRPEDSRASPPMTCTDAGPGQMAFIHGLRALGFKEVPLAEARAALRMGRKVLFHGWGAKYAELGRAHPKQVITLWHSGWTGSDLLGEGAILAEALSAHRQGHVILLWLDDRDVPPSGVEVLKPVWSPKDLVGLRSGTAKVPRRVVVGFHGPYPAAAKNSLAALAGCVGLGADIQVLRGALDGPRAPAMQALLVGERFMTHSFLPRQQAVKVLESAEVLVHPSLTDTWPYLVMEAIYAGTPVVVSDAIAWASQLPQWAQDLCIVRPATASAEIRRKVAHLLDHPEDRERLVLAQRAVLNELAPAHEAKTKAVLRKVGFDFPAPATKTKAKPKTLLLSDVRGWAFDQNLRDMAEYLKDEFDFSFWYVIENKQWVGMDFDIIYAPYLRWPEVNRMLDYRKALGSLRTRWFYPETPRPPGQPEFDLVNRFRGFHVVTQDNLTELTSYCPNAIYLTNPVNMRRFPTPTPDRSDVVVSWNGNAKHINAAGVDVKGFYSLVQPACAAADVPLVFVEYHTKRVPPSEMPAFYQQANLAVSVSLYEGASNSVMEAMASGQALITTDVGNHREMRDSQIAHFGDTGIVLVERNLDAVVEAIQALKRDPKRVREMGMLNRREIDERWSWSAWAERYADFLRMAL